ncbi:fatty acid CoA ligase FadD22 [Amycolatopsis xylanica]|uniref:Fatty acid CoA ligase FadD22 n=1 Tax=Amycolatopsis xylanica TaxID=589385 RepID=A0A1H2WBR2_9PSEU|nr:class I adenylate-forming enzyme family protein [Amycolatopsis xylanica]SDW78040.1 fatty acid CoA ligase FadD22 [Amycolatopsis xylanica]
MPDVSELAADLLPEPSAPLGVLAEYAAGRHGETPFLSDTPWALTDRPVRTFAEFAAAIEELADRLWAAGVRRTDTVAIVQRNHIEVEAAMLALARIGALPVLLSSMMEVGELLESVAKLDSPTVLVDDFGLARLGASRHALSHLASRVLTWSANAPQWTIGLGDREAHLASPREASEPFVVTHSSGTTGGPKLAAHSARSLFGMVAPMILILKTQYSKKDLNAKHLSFVHARTCAGTLASLETAIPMLSLCDPDPASVKEQLLLHKPTSLETHPNIFIHWERLTEDPDRPFASVQRFISTFDAMHPRTVRTLLGASDDPGAHYLQAYGQTESGPISLRIVGRADAGGYSPRNVGFPGGPIRIRVVDEAGAEVPAGETGYIETRSPGRMLGYLGGDDPMIPADAWWPMGDIGRVGADGSLELLDRIVEHVEGTESLLEREDQLLDRLPELVELVLVKTESGDGVFAVACVRAGEECTAERFQDAAKEVGLGAIPVRFWDWEALPLTGSYKVRRGVLRQRLGRRMEKSAPRQVKGSAR